VKVVLVLVVAKLVEMVMNRVATVVVAVLQELQEVDRQSLVQGHHTSLVDIMVVMDTVDLAVVVVTKVVLAVVLRKMVEMLKVVELLEQKVEVMVVMEKKFHHHTYQTHSQQQKQALVNS
tara:strand:- start:586 stop:945 length:360 start_codon:yes stop_codon:yes gene_type:complete